MTKSTNKHLFLIIKHLFLIKLTHPSFLRQYTKFWYSTSDGFRHPQRSQREGGGNENEGTRKIKRNRVGESDRMISVASVFTSLMWCSCGENAMQQPLANRHIVTLRKCRHQPGTVQSGAHFQYVSATRTYQLHLASKGLGECLDLNTRFCLFWGMSPHSKRHSIEWRSWAVLRYRKADATASFSRKITFSSDPYVDELGLLSISK